MQALFFVPVGFLNSSDKAFNCDSHRRSEFRNVGVATFSDFKHYDVANGFACHPFFKGFNLFIPFFANFRPGLHTIILFEFLLGQDRSSFISGYFAFCIIGYPDLGNVDNCADDLPFLSKAVADIFVSTCAWAVAVSVASLEPAMELMMPRPMVL